MSENLGAVVFIAALGLAAIATFMTFVVAPKTKALPAKWGRVLHALYFLPVVGFQAYLQWAKDPGFTSLWTSLWVGLLATLVVAAIVGLFRSQQGRAGGKEGFE